MGLDAFQVERLAAAVAEKRAQPPSVSSTTAENFGSYVCLCGSNSANVTFVNFPERDCLGAASLYTLEVSKCLPLDPIPGYTWEGLYNATNMWYSNYQSNDCSGVSQWTRTYETYKCFNCPNKECKNAN